MISVNGVYENGIVRLDRRIRARRSVKVIVTFLDEDLQNDPKRLTIKDFSYIKSREKSKSYTGSLSDVVMDERNSDL